MVQAMTHVNWLAVIVSGIVLMVLGFIWYTVFAKQWAAYTGWTREKVQQLPQNQMIMSYGITFISALVQVFVLASILKVIGVTGITTGLGIAGLVWLGFTAAPGVSNFAFEHRPWGLFALVNGLYLVNLLVASVILVVWK